MNEVTTEKLIADVSVLIDDVEALIKETADQTGERVGALRERLQRTLEAGKTALADYEKDLLERGEQGKACAIRFLRQESWPRVVAAAAVGILLGVVVRRMH